ALAVLPIVKLPRQEAEEALGSTSVHFEGHGSPLSDDLDRRFDVPQRRGDGRIDLLVSGAPRTALQLEVRQVSANELFDSAPVLRETRVRLINSERVQQTTRHRRCG